MEKRFFVPSDFVNNGYDVFEINNKDGLNEIRFFIEDYLKNKISYDLSLENYHEFVKSSDEHKKHQFDVFERVNEKYLYKRLIEDNLEQWVNILGPDIDIQSFCYVRSARPGKPEDNIGFHRDTFYGNSAYETSSLFVLTDNDENGAIKLAKGSHKWGGIKYEKVVSDSVRKGSNENKMGFLYEPKILDHSYSDGLVPVQSKRGECLLFNLGTLHGLEVNHDDISRWSIDFRVKPAFSPVSKTLRKDYYMPLRRGALTSVALEYYRNNQEEHRDMISNYLEMEF
ncbi:phytanoyl-CoA dioxygenase family protein [Marinomonas fungiae]|uniref:phytanoyl-CoA dioxygenase family protein n=1 Tax=Marinomonas fungiae TaxID=1137284 RepID=UPI003A8D6E18